MDKKILFSRMLKSKFFMVGAVLVLLIVLLSVFSPFIVQFDPVTNSLKDRLISPEYFASGLSGHVFGTDDLGRDIFSRLLLGSRYSLFIAAAVVLVAAFIGTILGAVSGYFGGVTDMIIMRLCDIMMAIPNLVLAIAVMAILGPNIFNLIIVLIVTSWVQYCKVTRNNVMVVKNAEFVKASQVLGAKKTHIMFRQIFPNVTTQLIILISQQFGWTILTEASLSFLSLGVQPPTPSWGNMIADGRNYLITNPWMVFAPGIALMITVLAFNFLGDGLRDVLDPKKI
ncbi:ABC transporter permease [Ruminococcaceae bacterium OttesenSCG-928-A16]|nr:ABC transporter permease [Ruminococcaceae bacterium OttesenSCG-928-A16]